MEKYVIPYGIKEEYCTLSREELLFAGSMSTKVPPLEDLVSELLRKLDNPTGTPALCHMVRGKRNVVILVEDNTRNTPLKILLPPLLEYLFRSGLSRDALSFLIATGTHRVMTEEEIVEKLGKDVCSSFPVYQHDATRKEELVLLDPVYVGEYRIPLEVNRRAVEADFLLGLGNIVPHADAGFSGGAKILQPGVCGFSSTAATHASAALAGGIPLGQMENPCRLGMEKVARRVGLSFIINTVMNSHDQVVSLVAGDFVEAHREGARCAAEVFSVLLPDRVDILIASSSPCDVDYWQANKAISAAWFALRPGGILIFVSPCTEGLAHNHPRFREWLAMPLAEILSRIAGTNPENVEEDLIAAVLASCNARVREMASIFAVTEGLSQEDLDVLGYRGFDSVEDALREARRRIPGGTVGILPRGGVALPRLMSGGDTE